MFLVGECELNLVANDKAFRVFQTFYRYGKNTNNDDIHQFFFLYALIDNLAREFTKSKAKELKERGLSVPKEDCDKLRYFLHEILNSDSYKIYFNCFNPIKRLEEEKKTLLIKDLKKGKNLIADEESKKSFSAIVALFMKIAYLRNKIFHGDIDFIQDRTFQIIREAAIVLEDFCDCLFNLISSADKD